MIRYGYRFKQHRFVQKNPFLNLVADFELTGMISRYLPVRFTKFCTIKRRSHIIMIKHRLAAVAAITLMGMTSAYAGPIQDLIVQIGPSAVEGLYVLDYSSSTSSIETRPIFSTVTKKTISYRGSIFRTTKDIITTKTEITGFKIIGNHSTDGTIWSASNSATGTITARIGKSEADFCTIKYIYTESPTPTREYDCSTAIDFEVPKVPSALDANGLIDHLYFKPKSGISIPNTDIPESDIPKTSEPTQPVDLTPTPTDPVPQTTPSAN
jgi:hypothetical protein